MIFWEMFMYHQNTLKTLSLQYVVMFAVKTIFRHMIETQHAPSKILTLRSNYKVIAHAALPLKTNQLNFCSQTS